MLSKAFSRAVAMATAFFATISLASANDDHGTVYTSSNATDGNRVLAFDRAMDGTLSYSDSFPTGGFGTGGGLGNQGALALSKSGDWLLVVNAGSSEVSLFEVYKDVLILRDILPSGGVTPVSVSINKDLVYVLNAGDSGTPGNITGFTLAPDMGRLTPLAGSSRPLSADQVGPAQIGINPWGNLIVVTEKATNLIVTYTLNADGIPSAPIPQASNGMTPFGFAFDQYGRIYVSEAFGDAANASAVSSYIINTFTGVITTLAASVPTMQTAACWVALEEKNAWHVYTTNTGSSTLTGFYIQGDGTLLRRNADGIAAMTGVGSSPIDMVFSNGSEFLYSLNGGTNTITGYRTMEDGSLQPVETEGGIPAGSNGLAAR